MGTKVIVVGCVYFPQFLAIGTIFSYGFYITAIFFKNSINSIGSVAFFR